MIKEEYLKRVDKEFEEHKRRLLAIKQEYAESNNPVKKGDIITDHYHTIKVDGWDLYESQFRRQIMLRYYGEQYTKQGVKSKKQIDTEMFQGNIIYINGNPL